MKTALSLRQGLAALAALLAILAAFAGSPYRSARGEIDVAALATMVAHEEDHVTALELARWIRARRAGLRVIDLRTPAEFEAGHIPTAENITLESLAHTRFGPHETIVLVSGGGAHAAQGWVFLRALGVRDVYFLRGGVDEWVGEVLHPAVASSASGAAIAALSRYFGGTPRSGDDATAAPPASAPAEKDAPAEPARWRRGC